MDKTFAAATLWDSATVLISLFGAGGLTSIVIAWFGTRRPTALRDAAAEPAQASAPLFGFQALLADHVSMERFSEVVRRLVDANESLAEVNEQQAQATALLAQHADRYCTLLELQNAISRMMPPPPPPRRHRRRGTKPSPRELFGGSPSPHREADMNPTQNQNQRSPSDANQATRPAAPAHTYQGQPVTKVRPAKQGDPDFDPNVAKSIVALPNGTQATVPDTEIKSA